MNERIVFTNADGSVGVLIPSGVTSIEEVMAKDVPAEATNARQITIAELPQDRLFRSAWDDSNPEDFIGTNFTKAKSIAHDIRRADRQSKLEPLDNEERFTSTSAARKDAIAIEKTTILNANAKTQIDIDATLDEAALRIILTNLG